MIVSQFTNLSLLNFPEPLSLYNFFFLVRNSCHSPYSIDQNECFLNSYQAPGAMAAPPKKIIVDTDPGIGFLFQLNPVFSDPSLDSRSIIWLSKISVCHALLCICRCSVILDWVYQYKHGRVEFPEWSFQNLLFFFIWFLAFSAFLPLTYQRALFGCLENPAAGKWIGNLIISQTSHRTGL